MDFVFFRRASPREAADFWEEQRLLAEQIRDSYDRDCEIKWAARREAARLKAAKTRNADKVRRPVPRDLFQEIL